MVITRYLSTANSQVRNTNINDNSDNKNDLSLPEIDSDNLSTENSSHHPNKKERDHERIPCERRFSEMNKQIKELTSLVRMLTRKVASNNREENDPNTRNCRSTSHSEKRPILISFEGFVAFLQLYNSASRRIHPQNLVLFPNGSHSNSKNISYGSSYLFCEKKNNFLKKKNMFRQLNPIRRERAIFIKLSETEYFFCSKF